MQLFKPAYYDSFHCIASRCPDTCCQLWDIEVDPDTAACYQTLSGPLGDTVRSSLYEEDGQLLIAMKNGRCPMQAEDGLCTVQSQLGEQALCKTCREFPRLHHDYGTFLELELELSCPEAARIVLTAEDASFIQSQMPGGSEPDYDQEAMELLLASRKQAVSILRSPELSDGQALALLLLFGCHTQAQLDGDDTGAFDPAASLETAQAMAASGDFRDIADFFGDLDILTEQWKALLRKARNPVSSPLLRPLARYLIQRYWLQAVSDYDLYCRVKFILISCLLVCALPGDFIWNAHLFSKEIENDADNVDAILDAAYRSPIFTDDKILGFLLGMCQNPTV